MRKLVLGFLLLAAVVAPLAFAGAADAAAPKTVKLRLLTIDCHESEEFFGDEAYLEANGARIWGPADMNNGDERSLLAVPLQPFRQSIDLALFDEDGPDPDDHLGTVRISRNRFRAGVQTATFTGDGTNYTVTYKVVR
jgi:hypothetical protein